MLLRHNACFFGGVNLMAYEFRLLGNDITRSKELDGTKSN